MELEFKQINDVMRHSLDDLTADNQKLQSSLKDMELERDEAADSSVALKRQQILLENQIAQLTKNVSELQLQRLSASPLPLHHRHFASTQTLTSQVTKSIQTGRSTLAPPSITATREELASTLQLDHFKQQISALNEEKCQSQDEILRLSQQCSIISTRHLESQRDSESQLAEAHRQLQESKTIFKNQLHSASKRIELLSQQVPLAITSSLPTEALHSSLRPPLQAPSSPTKISTAMSIPELILYYESKLSSLAVLLEKGESALKSSADFIRKRSHQKKKYGDKILSSLENVAF